MELARLKHRDYEIEAARSKLAAQVERSPHEGLTTLKSAVSGLRNALSRRRPAVAPEPRLQAG
jgi:hypothetical protein